jgi:hypothetical protein
MLPEQLQLREELETLRKGRGVQEPQLRSRMGPLLRHSSGVDAHTTHGDARRALTALLVRAADALPGDLRLAAHAMFAIDDNYSHRFLRQRYEVLARLWNCDFRTVQRRCDEALDFVVDQLSVASKLPSPVPEDSDAKAADSWYLERFSAVLLLNREQPQAIEERTLVATIDGLSQLDVAFGVPRHPRENRSQLAVDMEVLYGAQLVSIRRPGENYFVQYLALPRPLRTGERHTYARSVKIPPGQLMVPRYVHLPIHRCDLLELRVKFPLDALPRAVWLVSRLPELALASLRPGPHRIEPDSLGEVYVRFTDLRLGLGYGVAWLPAERDHE